MDLVFKSPMDTIWIDIYCCPDVQTWLRECYKMMEVVVSEQRISPDTAGVWHLSSVTSIYQAESAGDGAAVAVKEEDTNN